MIPQKNPIPQRHNQSHAPRNDENTQIAGESDAPSSGNKKATVFILSLIGASAIGIGAFFLIKSNQKAKNTESAEQIAEQIIEQAEGNFEDYEAEMAPLEDIEIPEEEIEFLETEEALREEILNIEKYTEILTINDEEKETETAIGTINFDQGTEDLNVVMEHKNEVTLDERKPYDVPEEKVFTSVEQMPQFPGGETAMFKYLSEHIVYPPMAQENNVQGRVVVQFVIKKDGSIGDVKVVRGKDPDLDREAVRVVKTFPKFTPGKMNGQPVNVWYTLPINFKLQGV